MKIKVLKMDEQFAKLLIEDTTPTEVNAIRRTLLSDVPTMAIEDVEFHLGTIRDEDGKESESIAPLFDEIIAHRLGLLPIPTDLDNFVFRDSCECGGVGCPHCTITYTINKKGPCTVYSGDLIPMGDPSLKVKDELIPIVELKEGQALLAYAIAELGTGKDHAKWQPVSGLGYRYYPTIEIDLSKCGEKCRKLVEKCPASAKEQKGDIVKITQIELCEECLQCINTCPEGAVKVEYDETKIIFHYETDGSISAKDAIEYAFLLLEDNFRDLADKAAILDKIAPKKKKPAKKKEPEEKKEEETAGEGEEEHFG